MRKLSKEENKIVQVVAAGQFDDDDLGSVKAMLRAAGGLLDGAESHEICGSPIFKAADGKWYTGSVEFSVSPINPKFLIDTLIGDEFCECHKCGHIEKLEDVEDLDKEDEKGDGGCTKCGYLTYKITPKRAEEIAAGKPLKKVKR